MFEKFMEDFVDCLDFMDYFKAIWYPRIGPWIFTLVPLPFASLETCVAMEFYHNQLKLRLLNEKAYASIASNLGSESVDRIVSINDVCGETVGEGISGSEMDVDPPSIISPLELPSLYEEVVAGNVFLEQGKSALMNKVTDMNCKLPFKDNALRVQNGHEEETFNKNCHDSVATAESQPDQIPQTR